jgi:hypothetical protein
MDAPASTANDKRNTASLPWVNRTLRVSSASAHSAVNRRSLSAAPDRVPASAARFNFLTISRVMGGDFKKKSTSVPWPHWAQEVKVLDSSLVRTQEAITDDGDTRRAADRSIA